MTKAGFFYRGFGDIVTCAFCGVSLHKRLQNDDPIAEHRKFNAIDINSKIDFKS